MNDGPGIFFIWMITLAGWTAVGLKRIDWGWPHGVAGWTGATCCGLLFLGLLVWIPTARLGKRRNTIGFRPPNTIKTGRGGENQ